MEPIVELMVTTGSSRSSLNQSPPNHKNMDKQQLPPTAPTSSGTWEHKPYNNQIVEFCDYLTENYIQGIFPPSLRASKPEVINK
ncbi:MULE domain-containing protein, partial [Aphis craccivora]